MNNSASPLQRFGELHTALYTKFRKHNVALHAVNAGMSALSLTPEQALIFAYVRLYGEAQSVERQIGLQNPEIDLRRHPLIELRLTENHLTLEFVLTPLAWWDQRNLIGKIAMRHHRDELCRLLMSMPSEMIVGHWQGTHLDENHITLRHLRAPRVMEAWLQTFTDSQDVIRIGRWHGADALNGDVLPDLFDAARSLYAIYRFLAWTSRNDFQSFYDQIQKSS